MKNSNLKKAEKYFKEGKYSRVIRLLEPDVFNYRDNDRYYYLLGISSLFTEDYNGANSYIRRSLQINPVSTDTLLALAVIQLKRNNSKESIRLWLEVLDKHPENKYAKRGLNLLNKSGVPDSLPDQFIRKNLKRLIPGKFTAFFYRILKAFLLTAAAAALSAAVYFSAVWILDYYNNKNNLIPEVVLNRNEKLTAPDGKYDIELTEKDIIKTFDRAREHFVENRDNSAQIEINRLLFSNASANVKDKAELLQSYLEKPDFRYFKNTIDFREVSEKPFLFNNCYVKWKGKITNITVSDKDLDFDFLVGYENGRLLEGIIRVNVDFPVLLEEDFSYEIIGKLDTSGTFRIKALSIRKFLE